MELQYLIVYLEVNALALIFLGIILFNVNHDFGSDLEVKIFKMLILSLITALIVDCCTHSHYRHAVFFPVPILKFLYSTHMFIMSGLMPLLWVLFAELRLGFSIFTKRKQLAVVAIPCIIIFILAYGSMKYGWLFTIDETATYHRGPLWLHQNIAPYFCFMITTIHGILKAKMEKSIYKKRQYYVIAAFMIAPFLAGILQAIVGGHPFIGPASAIAMFFIYIHIQVGMNNQDSLTTLNNRKRCIQYSNETIEKTTPTNPFYLMIMDINDFKDINDTYGHLEGDNALRVTAEVIKEVVDKHHGFVGRFGGDEFLFIVNKVNIDSAEAFINEVNAELSNRCKYLSLPYSLNAAFGYAESASNNDDLYKLIEKADNMMYQNKEQLKRS